MEKTLTKSSIGHVVKLNRIEGDELISERLVDMGFHPGVEIEFIDRMVSGGPFIIRVQSSFFALREEEAECLKVIDL